MRELAISEQTAEEWPTVWDGSNECEMARYADPIDDFPDRISDTRTNEPLVKDHMLFCSACGEFCIESGDRITLTAELRTEKRDIDDTRVPHAYWRGLCCANHKFPVARQTLMPILPAPVFAAKHCDGVLHSYTGNVEFVEGYNPVIIGEPGTIAVYREMRHDLQYPSFSSKMDDPLLASEILVRIKRILEQDRRNTVTYEELAAETDRPWNEIDDVVRGLHEDSSNGVWICDKHRVSYNE